MAEQVRFDLGFAGGGTVGGLADPDQWATLERSFESGAEAVLRVEVEGGTLYVRASQVAWARKHVREARVGF